MPRDEAMEANRDRTTGLLAAALTIAYAFFAHYASAIAALGPWVLLLAGAPMLIVGFGFARESRVGAALWVLTVAVLAVMAWLWPNLDNPVSWVYFLQHFAVNAVLALLFGRSLLTRRRPLCTVFASTVHEEMTPQLVRYTRHITAAWTFFFAASALLSASLFFFAPIDAWSMYANILTLPLVGIMFLAENQVRKHVLPERDQAGLRETVRAFRATFRP